jgi:anti-sigma B factor antagonist
MEIAEREIEGVLVLDLAGRLVAGDDTAVLRERLQALADAGKSQVLLNFAGVSYIDSTGLGAMVFCHTKFKDAGLALKMVGLNDQQTELMVITKLATVFEIYAAEREAIDSFFPNREQHRFDILDFVRRQKEQGQ